MTKSVTQMSLEEFKDELRRLSDKALHIDSMMGKRTNRAYGNQKRGNFHGKAQKNAREQLQELGITVKSNGTPVRGKYDG